MAKIDRIKADIAFSEKQIFAAVALVATLTAWCVSEYAGAPILLVLGSILLILLFSVVAYFKYKRVLILLEELDNAE